MRVGNPAYRTIVAGLLLAVVMASCGGKVSPEALTGDPSSSPEAPSPTATATVAVPPTVPPAATSTEPAAPPTSAPALEGLPIDVTGYELIAIRIGEAVYSGYACTIAPVGCACDQPVIQRASFEFVSEGTMLYKFMGSGYGAEWQMDRIGPNQWSYTIAMYDQGGQFEGAFFVLVTFAEDGFIITQGADLDEGGMIACPDVFFRRMMSDTAPEP